MVKDGVTGLDFVFLGGNISNGLEKVTGLAFISSSSKSLSSSGIGTVVATSKDSSSINLDQLAMEGREGPRWSSRFGGVRGGGRWEEGEGGESGKEVETARLKVGLPGVVGETEAVVGVRRRTESKECDEEGGVVIVCWRERGSLRGEREVVEVLVVVLVCEDITTGRGRGGEPTELLDSDGDRGRLGEVVVRAVEVAWCRNVGGSIAIAFAFALLAAITAATLLFFVCGVDSAGPDNNFESGHALSSCLRALGSKLAIIAAPLSFHTLFSSQ